MMNDKPLYKPFKSKAKNKKYSVYVMKGGKKRLIHFKVYIKYYLFVLCLLALFYHN